VGIGVTHGPPPGPAAWSASAASGRPGADRPEDLFDGDLERIGDAKREREARIVLAALQGIYGLTRDFEVPGELSLSPPSLEPEILEPVLHRTTWGIRGAVAIGGQNGLDEVKFCLPVQSMERAG
jgi:hypothetical protein